MCHQFFPPRYWEQVKIRSNISKKVLLFFVTQSFLSIRENISDVGCMDQKWGVTSLPEIAAAMFPKPAVCISQVCHWFATPKSLSNSKCTGPEIVRGYNTSFTLKGFTILNKNQSRNFCNTLSKINFLKVFFWFCFVFGTRKYLIWCFSCSLKHFLKF